MSDVLTDERVERLFQHLTVAAFFPDGADLVWRFIGGVGLAYNTRSGEWRGYFR